MTIRSRDLVLAVGTLAFAGACWIALIAVDATRAATNPETMRVLHTVIVGALITLTVVAAIWIAGVIVCREVRRDHGQQDRHLAALTNGQVEHTIKLDEITGEIPKVQAQTIVVRAADDATGDTLAAYARGYSDCKCGRPMTDGSGNVVPINGRNGP